MIECDYKALIDYAQLLNKQFNQIKNTMSDIENSFKTIISTSNWNCVTQWYFFEIYKTMKYNYDNIANKFNNINIYLDQVINNYIAFEQAMSSVFGG